MGGVLSKLYSMYANVTMGWDQLGYIFGGLIIGGLVGLVIGVLLVGKLTPGKLKRFFNYSLVFFGLIIGFIAFRVVTTEQ